MAKKKLGIGIIGSGAIAQGAHMPAFAALDDCEILAVADISAAARNAAAEKFDVPHKFKDWKDLLALDEIDVVSVCTPNAFHCQPTVDALRAGKHVQVEKPMAISAVEAKKMGREAQKAGKKLMVGQTARFNPQAVAMKEFVDSGAAGDIYYARAMALRRRGIPGWGAFTSKRLSVGGPIFDIGVHILDLTLYLMGFPEPKSVSGTVYNPIGTAPLPQVAGMGGWDPKKFGVEDFGVGLIKFRNGATAVLEASWALNLAEDMSGTILCGTKGGVQSSPCRLIREEHGALTVAEPQMLSGESGHKEQIRQFVECIQKDLPEPVPASQAIITQRILDGIYESSKTGKEVRV
jgi:predicted dehydrogenase